VKQYPVKANAHVGRPREEREQKGEPPDRRRARVRLGRGAAADESVESGGGEERRTTLGGEEARIERFIGGADLRARRGGVEGRFDL